MSELKIGIDYGSCNDCSAVTVCLDHNCQSFLEGEPAYEAIQTLQQENERLRDCLKSLGGAVGCFCDHKIGHPLCTDHSTLCKKARELLQEVGGDE